MGSLSPSRTSGVDPLTIIPRHLKKPFVDSDSFISAPLGLSQVISFTSAPRILFPPKYLVRRKTEWLRRNVASSQVNSKSVSCSGVQSQLNQDISLSWQ